jgi:hypothetical protein
MLIIKKSRIAHQKAAGNKLNTHLTQAQVGLLHFGNQGQVGFRHFYSPMKNKIYFNIS